MDENHIGLNNKNHCFKQWFFYGDGDLNSRAALTTYTLSRGTSSANLSTSPNSLQLILTKPLCIKFEKNDTEVYPVP